MEDNLDFPFVDEDGAYGMQQVVSHLVSQGHRRIACIAPSPDFMLTHYRLQGFKDGLEKAGFTADDAFV